MVKMRNYTFYNLHIRMVVLIMSKLYNLYKEKKNNDNRKYYLFKSGMFYIFIDEDAKDVSDLTMLKLSKLNDNIVKCGFPCNSLDKYMVLFNKLGIDVEIVNDNDIDINDKIINKLKKINIDNVTPVMALNILNDLVVMIK